MKKILTIFLLFLPIYLVAQTNCDDTTKVKTLGAGGVLPYYIVDGDTIKQEKFIESFRDSILTIDDIESISVLRNAYEEGLPPPINEPTVLVIKLKPKTKQEIIVLDAGYEVFLAMQKPKEMYSIKSLKMKNKILVNEWNSHNNDANMPETNINYDDNGNDLEFEYKLYMFFQYMKSKRRMSISENFK